VSQLAEILANPQFIGEPVNEAYDNLIEVKDGVIKVKNRERFSELFKKFCFSFDYDFIDSVIEQAGYPDGRRSILFLEGIVEDLTGELKRMHPGSSDYKKTNEAIETYKKAIEAGGESSYLKQALKQRRDDIINMFNGLGFQF